MRSILILIALIAISCSDSSTPTPEPPVCASELSTGLTLGATYAYTSDTYSISGSKFCSDDLVSVLINDQEIQISDIQDTRISFVVPSISVDSASIKIKTKTTTVAVKGKFAVFPGGGTWKEVAAFPGSGRTGVQKMIVGNTGYISGGNVYTGFTTGYNFTYFGDIFKYDPSSNAWASVVTDDVVKNKSNGIASSDGKLFLFPVTVSGPVTTYDTNSGSFGSTGSFSGGASFSNVPFSVGASAFVSTIEKGAGDIVALLIRKYNAMNNEWEVVASNTNADATTLINFAFERSGKVYIGTNQLNSKDLQFYSFDPVTNQFTTLIKPNVSAAVSDLVVLNYLFTIGDLAYFIETGSSSLSETSASVTAPRSILYRYNFKNNTFGSAPHTYPEAFVRVASLAIGGRGFAGLSTSASGGSFVYSQKFYEFTPK